KNPAFDELKVKVMLSSAGDRIPFTFYLPRTKETLTIDIEPRREPNDPNPVIGVRPSSMLKLIPKIAREPGEGPVRPGSAAAAAIVLDLQPDDVIIATSNAALDPEKELDKTDKLAGEGDAAGAGTWDELARRLRAASGQEFYYYVRDRQGKVWRR